MKRREYKIINMNCCPIMSLFKNLKTLSIKLAIQLEKVFSEALYIQLPIWFLAKQTDIYISKLHYFF